MTDNINGTTDISTEIAGEATRESVGTDLRSNDGTASGAPQEFEGETVPTLAKFDLPGPVFELEVSEES